MPIFNIKPSLGNKLNPIEDKNYQRTKKNLYYELLQAAGIDLWHGPLLVDVNNLIDLLIMKRDVCLAFKILQRIPKQTDKCTDDYKIKLAQNFFRNIGLKLRKNGELDIYRLRQIQNYANRHLNINQQQQYPLISIPKENKQLPEKSVRGRRLEKLIEQNQFVTLSAEWVKDNTDFKSLTSAKKWANKIKKNNYPNCYKYELITKYKTGRFIKRTFLCNFKQKNELIIILEKDDDFTISPKANIP